MSFSLAVKFSCGYNHYLSRPRQCETAAPVFQRCAFGGLLQSRGKARTSGLRRPCTAPSRSPCLDVGCFVLEHGRGPLKETGSVTVFVTEPLNLDPNGPNDPV